MILNNNAHQNPSTTKSLISMLASSIMPALITSKNKPSVNMVNGIVNITKTGFKNVLRKARTMAINKAFVKLVTSIPGNNQSVKKTANPEISNFTKS